MTPTNNEEHTLIVKNLMKRYKLRLAVKDISLSIKSRQIVGLLGPNGAGKTTAFYMIVGLVACDGGRILFDSKDISGLPMHKRARLGIGYLPQETSIFRKLSVEDNILAILELRKDFNKKQRHEELNKLLAELHIEPIRKSMSLSLSGGERRRVEIARALACDPKFILLDEPFAGVDPISVIDIKNIIRHLANRGIGVLITDHNVRETLDICEFAYIVNQGEILCEGAPEEILKNKQVRDIYLGEHFSMG